LLKKQKNKITRIKQNIFFKKQRTQTKNKKNFSLRKILKKKIKIHGITKRMKDGTEVFLNEKKKHRSSYKPLSRRAYKRGRYFRKKFLQYRYKTRFKHALRFLRKRFPLIRASKVHIKLRRRNTFLTCSTRQNKTLFTLSTGTFKYDGRKKSSPFARERLAREVAHKLIKKHYRLVDIYFAAKMGRLYRYIVKEFISSNLIIRMVRIKKIHSHGEIRPKKAKRK